MFQQLPAISSNNRRELKHVRRIIRFNKGKKNEDKKKVAAAIRRVKTMANALLRDIERK